MKFYKTEELSDKQKLAIMQLWNEEYPDFLAHEKLADFENYLANLKHSEHYIAENENVIVGWIVKFIRDEEPWLVLIIQSKAQGTGVGSKLLELVKQVSTELNGWVIDHNRYKKQNGNIYSTPLKFYTNRGFLVLPEKRLELEYLSAVKVKWTQQ